MKSIYFLPFILVLASASFAVELSNQSPPVGTFSCLAKSGTSLVVLEIYDAQGKVNKNFVANYIEAKAAKIKNVDAVIRVNDTFTPEDVCNAVVHALPAQFNGNVWFDVANQPGRWSLPGSMRLHHLEDLTEVCKDHGLKPGVYSKVEDWIAVMGSQGAGSDVLSAFPLWYVHQDGNSNFDDYQYVGFGSWKKPQMKNYQYNSYLCEFLVGSVNYYEA